MPQLAFFRGSDQDCLVAASLSCPVCLSSDVSWRLVESEYESVAECACRSCAHEHTLFLQQEQALRLALQEDRPLDTTPRPEPELVGL